MNFYEKGFTLITHEQKVFRLFLLIEKDYELSADKFSWMVDDKMYDKLKHNYNECPDNIVKSFVAYRLAHDNIYDRKCFMLIVYIV